MRRNSRLRFFLIFGAILSAALLSCAKKDFGEAEPSENSAESEGRITIGFSIDTLAIERWRRDCDVFLNTAKELGANVIVQNAGNSVEEQEKQINYLVSRGIKALVVVPKQADSLSAAIKFVRSKGIPVISYDRLLRDTAIDLYITIDSQAVGTLMAKELLRHSPSGSWFCIYGPEEDFNMTFIRRGVESALRNTRAHIDYVYYTDGWNYDLSYNKMAELLKGGRIPDAVIAGNDAVADSIIRALGEYVPERKVAVSGQDADIAGCQNVINGKQAITVYKPITELAERTAGIAVSLAQGKSIEEAASANGRIDNGAGEIPVVWLHPTAVTAANMDAVVIQSGFHTREEIYRN